MGKSQTWCRFQSDGGPSYGLVEDDTVLRVEGIPWDAHNVTSERRKLADIRLLVPVIPGTFYCAGSNYRDHIVKRAALFGREPKIPTRPDIGYRANNALCAHEDDIVKPADSGDVFEYEGELVAVFGKTAKKVSREAALDCVFGWTIGNDVSERTWQANDRANARAKNCDTFKPMGPWIVTGFDPADARTIIRMNGEETDNFATANMLFDTADFIVEVSKYATIQPGDIMWMGTDGMPRSMKPGDVVEVEITGLGTLRNRIVAEA